MELRQKVHSVEIALDNGAVLTGPLAIDAEGTPPLVRDAAQYALLAELEIACPPGDAIERFTADGPLALLPLPASLDDGPARRMSMVWCMPAATARARLALPDAQLFEQLGLALGHRLGRPTGIGPRSIFPLHTHRLAQVCEHRVVHLGNAAQSLHPVAGQGFNLGIRDCACLVDCLRQAPIGGPRSAPGGTAGSADPLQALHDYAARRRLDRTLFPLLTNALPRIFSSTLAPVVLARSAALVGMDLLPALRRPFTRILMYGAPR
jgi:2-octaprenyl-6-methoxyphenol hydroxylase